jgi:hypothetical protein
MNYNYKPPVTVIAGTDPLLAELKDITEVKLPKPTIEEAEPKFSTVNPLKPDEFEPTEPTEEIEEKKPQVSATDAKEQARLNIAFFDGIQQIALPIFYRKALFKDKTEFDKAKDIAKLPSTAPKEPGEDDLLEKLSSYNEQLRNLPFDEKEIKLLEGPAAELIKKYGLKSSPETLFIQAALVVMAPRLLPLLKMI